MLNYLQLKYNNFSNLKRYCMTDFVRATESSIFHLYHHVWSILHFQRTECPNKTKGCLYTPHGSVRSIFSFVFSSFLCGVIKYFYPFARNIRSNRKFSARMSFGSKLQCETKPYRNFLCLPVEYFHTFHLLINEFLII